MDSAEIFQVSHEAIYVLILISAPVMLATLFVGLVIALFQALTQIQEATLTFVPKIFTVFLMLLVAMPFMLGTLVDFTHRLQDSIVHVE